jgi:hypothetical protein
MTKMNENEQYFRKIFISLFIIIKLTLTIYYISVFYVSIGTSLNNFNHCFVTEKHPSH